MAETVAGWGVREVWIGCSGNFTIERVLSKDRGLRLHGNDVQLYSCAIGAYLAGSPLRVGIADRHREAWGWLEASLEEPAAAVATIMLSTRMLMGLGRRNAYYERIRAGYRSQWPELHRQATERVAATSWRLASFFAGDVMAHVAACPSEAAFVSFPPLWGGGYETMFRGVEEVFTWERPAYRVFEPASSLLALCEALRPLPRWLIMTGESLIGLEPVGLVQTQRGKAIHVYASSGPRRLTHRATKTEPLAIPRLGPGESLEGSLRLISLDAPRFDGLRAQYLAPGIETAQTDVRCGVLVGDRLIGAFAFGLSPRTAMLTGPDSAYLMSDFAVAPTAEPRLSKLVVMAALSTEARLLCERYANRRIRRIMTTAFSRRPTSMKYRGLMRLTRRAPSTDAFGVRGHMLNHEAAAAQWTLPEALERWQTKYRA